MHTHPFAFLVLNSRAKATSRNVLNYVLYNIHVSFVTVHARNKAIVLFGRHSSVMSFPVDVECQSQSSNRQSRQKETKYGPTCIAKGQECCILSLNMNNFTRRSTVAHRTLTIRCLSRLTLSFPADASIQTLTAVSTIFVWNFTEIAHVETKTLAGEVVWIEILVVFQYGSSTNKVVAKTMASILTR